jgi:hypothetical protein
MVIKSRSMRWTSPCIICGKDENEFKIFGGNPEEKIPLEDLGMEG